jgi:biotin synthase
MKDDLNTHVKYEAPKTPDAVRALFALPFNDLIAQSHAVYRQHFNGNEIQVSSLLNIKTGACPEDCSYCSQSIRHQTDLKREPLMALDKVIAAAKKAKESGATRFCMAAAWRGPRDTQLDKVVDMVKAVKDMGLETCLSLGLLEQAQADRLKEAGTDYYNHNIDCSESFYKEIISTRTFSDRINTLGKVQQAGLKVCCGGIIGMGERTEDRADMLLTLSQLDPQPESVPINLLVSIPGTPLEEQKPTDPIDLIRTIAVARILMPKSYVRLSAGREALNDSDQALCFFAGANSIFYGEKLLTTNNPIPKKDRALFDKLGLKAEPLKSALPQTNAQEAQTA